MELDSFKNSKKTILITGETGSGKSELAREIHKSSSFKNYPFVKLNLAALSDNLFESELFGHKKGSFTGASADKVGLLQIGDGGTIFLDEIGELSKEKQVKLLHLLDDGEYYPVGATRPLVFRGRFIFATNKKLPQLVLNGEFREDLYYRIRFCEIEMVPLRSLTTAELKLEITSRLDNLKVINHKYNLTYDLDLLNALLSYKWPGNYRELQNTLEYIFALPVDKLRIDHLPSWIKTSDMNKIASSKLGEGYYEAMEHFEREFFQSAMERFNGQINKTALEVGLSKVTLISKLKKYGINRRDYKIRGEAVGF